MVLYQAAQNVSGNFGGRYQADAICAAAPPADLYCAQLHAFVCYNSSDQVLGFPSQFGFLESTPVSTIDNMALFSPWNNFLQNPGQLLNTLDPGFDYGHSAHPTWFTGCYLSSFSLLGNVAPSTCDQWTTNSSSVQGEAAGEEPNFTWSSSATNCNATLHMLCICIQ